MSYLEQLEEIIERQRTETRSLSIEQISHNGIELSEFKRRSIGVQIYSEVLNENVWFCSDNEMAEQIQNDCPGAICYTTDELSKLIDLDPSKEFLKKIHNAKSVFEDSRILKIKNLIGED